MVGDTVTVDSLQWPSSTAGINLSTTGAAGTMLTTGTACPGTFWTNTTNPTMQVNQSGVVDLYGKDADIRVNGESLMETLRAIQDHLNMLRPNPELESEWDELRELGEQYRKLEAEFKEKSKMWNTLKKK